MKEVFSIGSKVKLAAPMAVPTWCEWDDDRGRVSNHVKATIRDRFFKVDSKVSAELVHIPSEVEREKLRKLGRAKVRLRMPSGESITITAELAHLTKA
jgi:hypothetical protein